MPSLNNIEGVRPAAITPFHTDTRIDFAPLEDHLGSLAATENLTAVVVNGRASGATSLSREERVQNHAVGRRACGDTVGLVAGTIANPSTKAVERAADSRVRGLLECEIGQITLADEHTVHTTASIAMKKFSDNRALFGLIDAVEEVR